MKDLCPPWWLLKWAKRYFIFIQIGELPTANATWGCLELRSFREKNFYHFWKLKCLKETDKLKLSLLCFSFANVWWQWQWAKLPRQRAASASVLVTEDLLSPCTSLPFICTYMPLSPNVEQDSLRNEGNGLGNGGNATPHWGHQCLLDLTIHSMKL